MKSKITLLSCLLLLCMTLSNQIFASDDCKEEDVFEFYCPPDKHVSCNDEIWDLSIFGQAKYRTHYGWKSAGKAVVHKNMNSCGGGKITRTWTVEDHYWNTHTCTQTIYIGTGGGFNGHGIHWPKDVSIDGCSADVHPNKLQDGWPTWNWADCSKVGSSYRDWVYTINGSCKKIVRVWTVMDWCQRDGWGRYKKWTHQQIIKIEGAHRPTVQAQHVVEGKSFNCNRGKIIAEPLRIYSHGGCSDDYQITHDSPYAYANGADISGNYPVGVTWVTYTIRYGCFGKIQCKTKVIVKDNSQPKVYCYGVLTMTLMGVDTDHDGVNDEGMVEVLAKSFDKGSVASCNGGYLRYSFSEDPYDNVRTFTCEHVGKNDVRMYVTDHYGRQNYCLVELNIQNNGANIPGCYETPIDTSVTHHDTIVTPIDTVVTPPDTTVTPIDTLPIVFTINGNVVNASGTPFTKADVKLSSDADSIGYSIVADTVITEIYDTMSAPDGSLLLEIVGYDTSHVYRIDTIISDYNRIMTVDSNGVFKFTNLSGGISYKIEGVEKSDSVTGLVNMGDANYLLEFITNKRQYTSLREYVASDIDKNGIVDLDDLNLLLDFLSGQENDLLRNDWVIVDSTYFKLDPSEAFDSLVTTSMVTLDSVNSEANFTLVAIKYGDIVDLDANNVSRINEAELRGFAGSTNRLKIMPNPFTSMVRMQYNDNIAGIIKIELFDTRGQVVKSVSANTVEGDNDITIDFSEIAGKGIFIYRITDDAEIKTGRLIRM